VYALKEHLMRDAAFNLRALPEPRIAWMVSRVGRLRSMIG
jgi:hypothetical protein